MNELAMNLASGRVDNRYLKVLIVGKAFFVKALCEDSAMCNRVGIRLEIPILSLKGPSPCQGMGKGPVSERAARYSDLPLTN
jgi:hypothetical protein